MPGIPFVSLHYQLQNKRSEVCYAYPEATLSFLSFRFIAFNCLQPYNLQAISFIFWSRHLLLTKN